MFLVVILLSFSFSHADYNILDFNLHHAKSQQKPQQQPGINAGEPLFLTPYIQNGSKESLDTARKLATVSPFVGNIKSYSGYITADGEKNPNLFFWFFESESNAKDAPVLLWLHGGPGLSSLMALFEENGPYRINNIGIVSLAKVSWTKKYNVLYIDNPVGAGYSFSDSSDGYSTTVNDSVIRVHSVLTQFFQLFSEYKNNPFYLTGQSYAGKYIPELASVIHDKNNNNTTKIKINLKGLFIGCGYIDPVNQLKYADFLHEYGIFDRTGREAILDHETSARSHIKQGNYFRASYHFGYIGFKLYGSGYEKPFIDVEDPKYDLTTYDRVEEFVQLDSTRKTIHVGSKTFNSQMKVVWNFRKDFYNSASSVLSEMLKHYKVLLYSGEFDMIIPPGQTQAVIENLSWSGKEKFLKANRKKWIVDGEVAGYKQSYGNLMQVLVHKANHVIIRCQQKWLFDLITSFVS